jgi:DnaA-homolog protein
MKQLPLALGIRGSASFDTFQVGSNAAPLAALAAWIQRWQQRRGHEPRAVVAQPPLYLWGPTGSGKTYLMTALAAQLQAQGARVAWMTPSSDLPWTHENPIDLVLIDDCDDLDDASQQAAFATFVESADAGFAIIAAGRQPPVDLGVREDLRTRLGWGEVHAVVPLSEAETRATLRQEADRRGIFLNDEVMAYLLTHFHRDLRSLMALLDRLDAYALASKRGVTLALLRRMLDEEGETP